MYMVGVRTLMAGVTYSGHFIGIGSLEHQHGEV